DVERVRLLHAPLDLDLVELDDGGLAALGGGLVRESRADTDEGRSAKERAPPRRLRDVHSHSSSSAGGASPPSLPSGWAARSASRAASTASRWARPMRRSSSLRYCSDGSSRARRGPIR